MTRYLGVSDMVTLTKRLGLAPMLRGLAKYIAEDFQRWADFEHAPRMTAFSPSGVIELMPTYDGRYFSFKYVSSHPANPRIGLPTVGGFGMLSDVNTGSPVFLSEMTLATALRTGATSALAATFLARRSSSVMAIIGLGSQSEFQAAAFKAIVGISKLRVFDTDPAALAKFVKNSRGLDLEVSVATNVADAVSGADIVTTITADNRDPVVLSDNHIGSGVHVNAVGGDCPGKIELQASILSRARTFVEFEEQTRIEGELQQMPKEYPVTELWRVISGQLPGRMLEDEITVFDSVGFALEDYSTLRYLHDFSRRCDVGAAIDLMPRIDDPKDLFSLVACSPIVDAASLQGLEPSINDQHDCAPFSS